MECDTDTPPYCTGDKSSFAYVSARDRWPIILTGIIDDLHKSISQTTHVPKREEGKLIVAEVAKLKYELQHDRPLIPLCEDGQHDIAEYNEELEIMGNPSWFNTPWLFAECYLYRRIATYFTLSEHWKEYDVFAQKKISTFHSSRPAVLELAFRYREIILKIRENAMDSEGIVSSERILFNEIFELCLWGNATDLSLLTSLNYDEIQKLQGLQARKCSKNNILINDLESVYDSLEKRRKTQSPNRKVDIVLDNAGFELYVDLILAGFLLATGLATKIVMHAKSIPWFVSDVLPTDFSGLLKALATSQEFFSALSEDEKVLEKCPEPLSQEEVEVLLFLFEDWNHLHTDGKIELCTNRFWTQGGSFWRLPSQNPQHLFHQLKKSELVIFKGDLNYRKLTCDATWDPTTPFAEALGPMGLGSGVNVLALRTCKSDVIVGLKAGEDEELRNTVEGGGDTGARKWAWTGKWAVISFSQSKPCVA
ncbi:BgTH12-01736 [Blumeria graminis f. sp. triticale]|uniref:Sugar phosphate phosphatase n=3 Tax=Blumeria graminis TaxID=34373 RepID=A0A061HGL6_BLUGR|nr:hypothetical protein BGT96224_2659 [Blumeria graminis f. sp. tritici 96224]CAD6501484.1 BgTH12-01736 [Blumeria graminis f. sp. triticale]VDB84010.1 Bgt-2659 [Blumeria graminis f. sp. tritici]